MPRNRQTPKILLLTGALAALSLGLLHTRFWRAELAETNFQANLIRLQVFLFGPQPKAVIAGSSFAGRLLPSYFENTRLWPMANLGLDGSSAMFGLGFCAERPPRLMFVELNTLLRPPDHNDQELEATVRSFGFRLARYIPLLQARGRPSSVLYTWMKARRGGNQNSEIIGTTAISGDAQPHSGTSGGIDWDPTMARTKEQVVDRIKNLRRLGCQVVLVRLPWGNRYSNRHPAFLLGDELTRELNLVQIDLALECAKRECVLVYTDGMHLSPASAREASRILAELAPEIPPGSTTLVTAPRP
jgi:hypothetical protein